MHPERESLFLLLYHSEYNILRFGFPSDLYTSSYKLKSKVTELLHLNVQCPNLCLQLPVGWDGFNM